MRHQTLKTYVKDRFLEYYKKPLRFKTLLAESKSDSRLAELSQVHFLLKGDQCKSDEFARYTGEQFFLENFKYSNQKYVYQFNKQENARRNMNRYARQKLKMLFEIQKYSMYRVAKELNTNQSNLSEFYKNLKDNKLDSKKVLDKYGWE